MTDVTRGLAFVIIVLFVGCYGMRALNCANTPIADAQYYKEETVFCLSSIHCFLIKSLSVFCLVEQVSPSVTSSGKSTCK